VTAAEPALPDGPAGSRVGRPRSEAVSRAILSATLDLIAETGSVAGLSMEAVAVRSGASKATIYRRWPSKEALVAAAVDSIKSAAELDLPHESVRDDLVRLGRSVRGTLSQREQRIMQVITFESSANPDFRKQQHKALARRRDFARGVFRYWVQQGELRDDIDVGIAAAMFINTILMIVVYDHYPDLRSPDVVERIVDHLLPGIAAGTR
jgi:AcrR family transcriptional regulator